MRVGWTGGRSSAVMNDFSAAEFSAAPAGF